MYLTAWLSLLLQACKLTEGKKEVSLGTGIVPKSEIAFVSTSVKVPWPCAGVSSIAAYSDTLNNYYARMPVVCCI
jgi:hypothetical protein